MGRFLYSSHGLRLAFEAATVLAFGLAAQIAIPLLVVDYRSAFRRVAERFWGKHGHRIRYMQILYRIYDQILPKRYCFAHLAEGFAMIRT